MRFTLLGPLSVHDDEGPVNITGHGGTAASREAFTARPGIVLSALSGPPGTIVMVAGAGFAAEEAVDIYLGADFSLTDQAWPVPPAGGPSPVSRPRSRPVPRTLARHASPRSAGIRA